MFLVMNGQDRNDYELEKPGKKFAREGVFK